MKANKKEKERMNAVAMLGCCICMMPAEVHHIKTHMGGERDHMKTIPICPYHHRTGGYGVALHAGKKRFEENYGTETDLLEITNKRIGYCDD